MDDISKTPAMLDPDTFVDADDNVIQTFQLESSDLRGRAVKLGSVLDEVLSAHNYPAPIAHLVAEVMTLCVLLSSMLKYKGIFTLQAKGDGPVSMLIADMTSEGGVRACATYDDDRLQQSRAQLSALKTVESSQNQLAQYLGKGYIAFTVQPEEGLDAESYQGVVELKGASLTDCVQHYFSQSEQIMTGITMAAGQRDGEWRAGAVMLQQMPEEGGERGVAVSNLDEDDWRRAMILLDSTTEDELLDAGLHTNLLLRRLYHEEGVRVFEPQDVQKDCRCSTDKVERVIKLLSAEDLDYMAKDGKITMHCEFCSRDFVYNPEDISIL